VTPRPAKFLARNCRPATPPGTCTPIDGAVSRVPQDATAFAYRDGGGAAYRSNYDRLAQVKHRYDPDNTFHINQNIRPASPDEGRMQMP
jgi:hypothetical protein